MCRPNPNIINPATQFARHLYYTDFLINRKNDTIQACRAWNSRVIATLYFDASSRGGRYQVLDAKTTGRFALASGPEIIEQSHQRVMQIAHDRQIFRGRPRVSTNVVSFIADADVELISKPCRKLDQVFPLADQ
jgi:hypothetical protein